MKTWAVFDVDGTLLPGTSMEAIFIRECLRRKVIPLRNWACAGWEIARKIPRGNWRQAARKNKIYLKNLPVTTIVEIAEAVFADAISPKFSETGQQKMCELKQRGYGILLMTGSPCFLAKNLSKIFDYDELICTKLEISEARFTGKISGQHAFGEIKRDILLQKKSTLGIDFFASQAFANHVSDAAHLALFGRAVAVNPDNGLREIARARGWQVENWKYPLKDSVKIS